MDCRATHPTFGEAKKLFKKIARIIVEITIMSRIEGKYCFISNSYLAGIIIRNFQTTSYLTKLCVFWCNISDTYKKFMYLSINN